MNTLVTEQSILDRRCAELAWDSYIAIDTEFERTVTYWPKLSLVQLAGQKQAFVVDALAGLDLAPLWNLLKNKKINKVIHAPGQDFEIFLNLMGDLPEPFFDSQTAAQFIGLGRQVSYARLVERFLDCDLDKSSRHTNWLTRPLAPKQVRYALDDVTHLLQLYPLLCKELEKRGRLNWALQEMEPLSEVSRYVVEPDEAWKRLKLRSSKPKFLSAVQELAAWREREAMKRNRPRNHILRDDVLLELAATAPKTLKELGKIKSGDSLVRRWGESLPARISKALNRSTDSSPRPPEKRKPREASALAELLRVLLKSVEEREEIAASVLASSAELEAFAAKGSESRVPFLEGWRYDLFGKQAESLRAGKLALVWKGDKLRLVETESL